jgi:hypothetical protein
LVLLVVVFAVADSSVLVAVTAAACANRSAYSSASRMSSCCWVSVRQRYKLRRSIVITSNRVVQDWGKYLGDATMATTILDRLMHRCAMLEFEGKSYRLKEAAARIAVAPESS